MKLPVVVTVAGSDSGGGAGVQADLKTFMAFNCYGTSVVTAVTAQNTEGVQAVEIMSADLVTAQLKALFDDFDVAAVKVGMLGNAAVVEAFIAFWTQLTAPPPLIIDPVMVVSADRLLTPEAETLLRDKLFPLATLITPNCSETARFLNREVTSSTQKDCAWELQGLTRAAVLLKGGHLSGPVLTDVLVQKDGVTRVFEHASWPVNGTDFHGTGCTLSAAITAGVASGLDLSAAVANAVEYVQQAIRSAPCDVGRGPNRPLNHHYNYRPTVSVPTKALPSYDPYPFTKKLVERCGDSWERFVGHPFVKQVGEGGLASKRFVEFLVQEYLCLIECARACALAATKSCLHKDLVEFTKASYYTTQEMRMLVKYCGSFGVSEERMDLAEPSETNQAFRRFITELGTSGSALDLLVAMYPRLLGYALVCERLSNETKENGTPYKAWIDSYGGGEFQEAVRSGRERLERMASEAGAEELERLCQTFRSATELAILFWDAPVF